MAEATYSTPVVRPFRRLSHLSRPRDAVLPSSRIGATDTEGCLLGPSQDTLSAPVLLALRPGFCETALPLLPLAHST